jgi:hypothetical protein
MSEYGVATTCNKDLYVEVSATQTVNERNNSCRLFFFMEVQLEEERITFAPQVPPGTSIQHHTVQERILQAFEFLRFSLQHEEPHEELVRGSSRLWI